MDSLELNKTYRVVGKTFEQRFTKRKIVKPIQETKYYGNND